MSTLRKCGGRVLAGLALAGLSAVSHSAVTPFFALQAPKSNLNLPAPPLLSQPILSARNDFAAFTTPLGGNEFESALAAFSYNGGSASVVSGTPKLIDGNLVSDHTTGRYNMTTGLAGTDYGRWIEASSDFTYKFTAPITAFAFFGTDFGDFDGSFSLEFLSGGAQVYSRSIGNQGSNQNGNLLFFGAASTVAFDSVVFHITQAAGGDLDILGFDSFLVGSAAAGSVVPEPGALALAGLALLAMSAATAKGMRMRMR